MFDETNQALENNEIREDAFPESLFDDEDVEKNDEATAEEKGGEAVGAEETAKGTETDTNQVGEVREEGTLRVKYNGKEQDIPLSDARTLAQKGMNYDHVVTERDRYRKSFDILSGKAKAEGITVEELIERENKKSEDALVEAEMSKLREMDDDASDATLEALAKHNIAEARRRAESEAAATREKEEREGWDRLFEKNPELISDKKVSVVNEILKLTHEGYTPTEAYLRYQLSGLEEKEKMESGQRKAAQKSVGSLKSNSSVDDDAFLSGFDEE